SKGDEFSLEDLGLRQGIFSHFLMKGLKGEADSDKNKIVTITELYDFVADKVSAYTNYSQNPTISGNFDPRMPVSTIR
ncbi:MAG: peptidase C14 caspase catalytic subunit p20, partial [Saprospiraceae bacterium]|nr:peptidase C14 caspase catalytic subunit p20 [Saprospiraceae bacterium]